ncbi:MAG: Cna B-type domain-containing protein [Ndongobacter sp.]|nr:Cna B-type domain-containing protein [Ndongobacter sp.]
MAAVEETDGEEETSEPHSPGELEPTAEIEKTIAPGSAEPVAAEDAATSDEGETNREPAAAEETSVAPVAEVTPLKAPDSLREASLSAVYVSNDGDDANAGDTSAHAVNTLEKAFELVGEGGTIYVNGAVALTSDTTVGKNITLSYRSGASVTVNSGIRFSMGADSVLTVKTEGSTPVAGALIAGEGAVIGDGKYVFDFSSMDGTNQFVSSAFKLLGSSRIEGSDKGGVKVELTNVGVLAPGTGAASRIINAAITQENSANKNNFGGGAPYNLVNTTYHFKSPSSTRMRFDKEFTMEGSELIIEASLVKQYAVIFAGLPVPRINNSTINIVNYGSILLDQGSANVTNSIVNTDGIHTPVGGKPFKTVLFGTVDNTSVFTFTGDPNIGRVSFTDANGNRYEYGLPVKHNADVSKAIPLPKATLTFRSEDGTKSREFTVIDGASLEALSGKVSVDGALIDKGRVAELENEIEAANGGSNIDFSMFVDGDEAKPYQFTERINGDTTIVLKEASGVRYYLNDGSENADSYVFAAKNEGSTAPLSLEEIIAKNALFKVRSKTFLGWYLDKEGTISAGEIDITSKTHLYAKWEAKKAFNVTYYRNMPSGQPAVEPSVVKATLYEGEHLAGVMVDLNAATNLIGPDEAGTLQITKAYYQSEFGGRNTWLPWQVIGDYGIWNIIMDDFSGLYRTQAWNTAPDGSGTYYRGGHTLTAADFEATGGAITLYNQWIELEKLKTADAAAIANPDSARPNILLSGEDAPEPADYESASGALVVDHSQALNYYAYLNYEKIRTELVTLWGRINEVTEWHGSLNAYFDARLDFDKNVQILFESTWQIPDKDQLEAFGVTDVRRADGNPNQWLFTIDKDKLMANVVTQRTGTDEEYDSADYAYYKVSLPVKIIPKYDPNGGADFQKLSFDDFMRPMTLTVYDNYGRGINAYVSKESANKIALSDKPVVIVGGDIQMNINGFERQGLTLLKYQLKSNAFDEHAKLYPSGEVHAKYELVQYDEYSKVLDALKNPSTGSLIDSFRGRAENEKGAPNDPNNYSEKYNIAVPEYQDGVQNYDLVAVRIQVQEYDENGALKRGEDGKPIIAEKIYSDRFYTVQDGLAGSLAEGKALLTGEFAHSKITTYVLQYAEPTVDVAVVKSWLDDGGHEMAAPTDAITVELVRDGEATGQTRVLTDEQNWTGKFEMLKSVREDGTACQYTVKEVGENALTLEIGNMQFKVRYGGNMQEGYTITNEKVKPMIPEKPVEPGKPITPEKPSKPDKPIEPGKTETTVTRSTTLPKTGDDGHTVLYGGAALIAGLCLWMALKRRNAEK